MISSKEEVLLDALLERVQVVNVEQSQHILQLCRSETQRIMAKLTGERLIRCIHAYARRPKVDLVCAWKPGDSDIDVGATAYGTRAKWLGCETRALNAYSVGQSAGHYLGKFVPRIKLHQVGHDLAVTDVYLEFCRSRPSEAIRWHGENKIASERCGSGEKLPDAVIADASGDPQLAIELCSGYTKRRLQEFVDDCVSRELPFEIWG